MSIDVIKIFHIINNNINQVIVFGQSKDILKSDETSNTIDETIFSKDELDRIKKNNANILFSSDTIYLDDTVEVIKKKILKELSDEISYDEMYLFAKQLDTLHNIEIYQKLTQNGKIELTKARLLQFLSNIEDFDMDSIEDKTIYNFDDIIELNLNNKTRSINITLGQNIITNENKYAYTINPYDADGFDSIIENHAENIISTSNHNLLLSSGFIVNNSIYLCDATNVLNYVSKTGLTESTAMKVYYPYLYNNDVRTSIQLKDATFSLREQNKKILNANFTKNTDNIKLFYDIYNKRTKDLDYIEQGIQTIEFVIYPEVQYNMPLEILFKLIHTDRTLPFIKYNPSSKQENIYRLYCDKTAKNGKKIPYLSKTKIIKISKQYGNSKRVTCYIETQDKDIMIPIILEFDNNGNIYVYSELKHAIPVSNLETIISTAINPIIETVQSFIKKSGYELAKFDSFYNSQVDITSITYFAYISIKNNIQLNSLLGCISSVFNVISGDLSNGIVMRYKRVENFNEMDSQEAYIVELLNKHENEREIINGLMSNFQLSEEDATEKIVALINDLQVVNKLNSNKRIKVKNNPGFLTKITKDQYKQNIMIQMDDINDIYYLSMIPIYLDSIIRITQEPESTRVSENEINYLCKASSVEKVEDIDEIIADANKPFPESVASSVVAQDLVYGEVAKVSKDKTVDVFDLLYDDDDEDDDDDDDNDNDVDDDNKGEIQEGGINSTDNNNDIGKDTLQRNVDGMKIADPNPFFKRLEDTDPTLFLTTQKDNFSPYSKICPWNKRRQPVIISDEEKEKIDKDHPDSYENAIKYGSTPDNQNWYICPRYWSLKDNVSLTQEQVDSGKYGEVIPQNAKKIPKGKYIWEFTDEKAHKDKDGKYKTHHPGFLKPDVHPDGLCVPCCFSSWENDIVAKRRNRCLNNSSEKTENGDNKDDDKLDEYIKGPDKFPIESGRWGYLPVLVQHFLNTTNSKCQISHINTNLKENHPCIIRQGVENNSKQSFVACIADVFSDILGSTLTISNMLKVIKNSITLDKFIEYHNGSLLSIFKTDDSAMYRNIDIKQYKNTKTYKKFHKTNLIALKSAISSLHNFYSFLEDDNNYIDYTYLWDIVCDVNKNLFKKGLNLIILELPQDDITSNVNIICPSNHFSNVPFDSNKPSCIIMKKYDFYEPIYTLTDKGDEYELIKLYDTKSTNTLPNIKKILKTVEDIYNTMCKPLNSMPKLYKFVTNDTLYHVKNILDKYNFTVKRQVVNDDMKTIGLIIDKDERSGFISCYPSAIYDDIDIISMNEKEVWTTYDNTKDFLEYVLSDTNKEILCEPLYKVIDGELIVGILTQTNQMIPLISPEENRPDELKNIYDSNYIIADSIIQSSSKTDNKRDEFIQQLKIQTIVYNQFRNTVRLLLNQYDNNAIRDEIEEISKSKYMLYSLQLERLIKLLKTLTKEHVKFITSNKKIQNSLLAKIEKNDKMSENDSTKNIDTSKVELLLIPKMNDITNLPNDKTYYGKLADEIIRYNRIKQFMFEPKMYLSFYNIQYNLNDNEIILLQSLLTSDYFDDLIPELKNKYVTYNSYDTAEPNITFKYDDEYVKIDNTTQSQVEVDKSKQNIFALLPECEVSISELPNIWLMLFPTYKGIKYNINNPLCSFLCILEILHNNKTSMTIIEVKNKLIELYKPLLNNNLSVKMLELIGTYNYKSEADMILNKQLTIDTMIINESYRLTPIDIWLLANEYNIPIVLLNANKFTQTNSRIISLNVVEKFAYFIMIPDYSSTNNDENKRYNMVINEEELSDSSTDAYTEPSILIKFNNLSKTIVDEIKTHNYQLEAFIENNINQSTLNKSKKIKKTNKLTLV